jgi:hypothetical protein
MNGLLILIAGFGPIIGFYVGYGCGWRERERQDR